MRRRVSLGAVLGSALLVACSGGDSDPQEPGVVAIAGDPGVAEYVAEGDFPHLRFPNGQISLNDRCPVRRVKLNRRMPAIYVNGRPIGFC